MCIDRTAAAKGRRQRGISLIETILFIVIVGVGVAGLAGVLGNTLKYSADPMIRKQAVAVAESLLEEIMLQPFTDCDPDAYDATNPSGPCATPEALGPETIGGVTESRTSVNNPFDNVNDYHGYTLINGIRSITDNSVITGLESYGVTVTMAEVGTDFGLGNAAHALKINVSVTGPNSESITLTGYRFRYDPNP